MFHGSSGAPEIGFVLQKQGAAGRWARSQLGSFREIRVRRVVGWWKLGSFCGNKGRWDSWCAGIGFVLHFFVREGLNPLRVQEAK